MDKFLSTFGAMMSKAVDNGLPAVGSRAAEDRALGEHMVEERVRDVLALSEDGDPCMLSARDIAEMRAVFSRTVSGAIDAFNDLAADAETSPVSARDLAQRMDDIRTEALKRAGIVDG